MKSLRDRWFNRREWLRAIGRGLSLAGLTAVGAFVTIGKTPSSKVDCKAFSLCRGCNVYDGCSLPQAIDARKQRQGESS